MSAATAPPPVPLEIFSDIACPWCFIGKRRLARALATAGAPAASVTWRAFELQPQLPAEGVDARRFFAEKFGGELRVRAIFDRVAGVGRHDGITFAFEKMRRAPNTRLAHRAVKLLPDPAATLEACFRGHFELGVDVGDADALVELLAAEQVPGDLDALRAQLADGAAVEAVVADERRAAELGVTGVPFFIAGAEGGEGQRVAVSGAQPPEVLVELLRQV